MSLYNTHFSHQHLKNYAIALGSILTGIEVVRWAPNGTEASRVSVPVTHSPKEKFIRRLLEDPDLMTQPAITLPIIGYEMTGLQYAADRKISSQQTFVVLGVNGSRSVYTPVPYDMVFEARIAAKTQEDALQIVEQIAPFFTPDFTISIRGVKNENLVFNVPITLDYIQRRDDYEGRFEDNRVIIWTLGFVVKGYLFGPVRDSSVIKHIDLTVFDKDQLAVPANLRHFLVDYDIEPYIPGVPLANINFDSPYTIKTDVTYG